MDDTEAHLNHFGLREEPFAPTSDPAYFYAIQDHRECLARLWSSIDARHGIAVVLGNYGTGKTTLLRKLLADMAADPERYTAAVIGSPIPSWTSFALLEAIVAQFGLQPRETSFTQYMDTLYEYLLQQRDKVCTLIIDDAQNLNKRGQLELLRLVQNLETRQHKLLNLVLFAQLEWIEVLRAAPNFEQRVNMTYTLSPLSLEDTHAFIDFRLAQAGATLPGPPHFSAAALAAIHAYSEGSPRVIVTLCRNALLLAGQRRLNEIDHEVVIQSIEKTMLHDPEKRARVAAAVMEATRKAGRVPAASEAEDPNAAPRDRAAREQRAAEMLLRGVARTTGEE